MNEPIGKMLDELGVTLSIEPNQRLVSVYVIGKVIDLDAGTSYLVLGSNNLDWIDEGGLIAAAEKLRSASIAMQLSGCDCDGDEDA